MVSSSREDNGLVHSIRLSSVGPGNVSGENMTHEPTNLDLAMKLHYLRAVYFFSREARQGMTPMRFKETSFAWFNHFFLPCGRFRRAESGRPYIKCNDCGVRYVEALCEKTIEEWLEMGDDDLHLQNLLVPHNVLGPELAYSPLLFLQVTFFKCGGFSLGLGWSHVVGDAFSASDFMNAWGQVIAGLHPNNKVATPKMIEKPETVSSPVKEPVSAKRVDPVGDLWIPPNNTDMQAFSVHVSSSQLTQLKSKLLGHNQTDEKKWFEPLCAVVWRCIARVKEGPEPRTVTICRKYQKRRCGDLSNGQIICSVKADFSVLEADVKDLATLLKQNCVDERRKIEEAVEREEGASDFIVYGANLTFVDLEEADMYGFVFQGEKPLLVNYRIEGVGEEGVVLVQPETDDSEKKGGGGRTITITLPENLASMAKSEVQKELLGA